MTLRTGLFGITTLLRVILLLHFCACGSKQIPPPEARSTFLDHREAMSTQHARAPFDLIWVSDRKRIDTLKTLYDKFVVEPVSLEFFQNDPKDPVTPEELSSIAHYMRREFIDALQKYNHGKYTIVDAPGPNTFVLQLALLRLERTTAAVNIVENVAGLFIPGALPVTVAANMAGAAAAHELGKGEIAFALKLKDGVTGESYAESYDLRADRAALLLNVQDFTAWGNAKMIIRNWAWEFAELMNTPGTKKVSGPWELGLILW